MKLLRPDIAIQVLQQPVRRQLDLFVPVLGGAVVTGDDPGAVDAPEVAEAARLSARARGS